MERLGIPTAIGVSRGGLEKIFWWFLEQNIPYETVSNYKQNVLIKNAGQMVEAIEEGFGGHCVEHTVLFTALLNEMGFDATLINADYHDHVKKICTRVAKPLTLVRLPRETVVCDAYYRRMLLRVPEEGEAQHGGFRVRRANGNSFSIEARRGGVLVNEDVAHEDQTIVTRQRQFADRYATFLPFGVTAPYFQVLRPIRKALYYVPQDDRILAVEGERSYYVEEEELMQCEWIPSHIRSLIPEVAARNRTERTEAIKFLRTNAHRPNYERPDEMK